MNSDKQLETVRHTVERLLNEAKDADSVEKAIRAAALLVEMEKAKSDARKAETEAEKNRSEISQTRLRNRSEERKHYFSLLAPLLSTVILAGTLLLQTYQAILSDREKQTEFQRQRDAAEDLRWTDTLKTLSQDYKEVSPGLVNLQGFLTSKRYSDFAKKTAEQALLQASSSLGNFKDLFLFVYQPVDWQSGPKIIDLARYLMTKYFPLNYRKNNNEKLSENEEREWIAVGEKNVFICSQLSPLLKGIRPKDQIVDLRSMYFWDCDFSDTNLSGADVGGFGSVRMNFKGADLSNLINYETSYWGTPGQTATAWWQASKISPTALSYLKEKFPYTENTNYGAVMTSSEDYNTSIIRLSK